MGTKIRLEIEGIIFEAELYEGRAAAGLVSALPLSGVFSRWGDEYYGRIAAEIEEDETARTLMEAGEIAFWPPGNAFCIFFGPTPASTDERPCAASDVVPLGRIIGETAGLVKLGDSVRITITTI